MVNTNATGGGILGQVGPYQFATESGAGVTGVSNSNPPGTSVGYGIVGLSVNGYGIVADSLGGYSALFAENYAPSTAGPGPGSR